MNSLTVFEFESQEVRIVEIDNEPWFVAKDVLVAIGSSTKVTDLKALVCADLGDEFVTNESIKDSLGRSQEMLLLSEPALTLFVSRSRTELGKALNRWIHSVVLPTIRKTGSYSEPRTPAPQSSSLDVLAQSIQALAQVAQSMAEVERRQREQGQILAQLVAEKEQAEEELASLPLSDEPAAEIPTRARINMIVRNNAQRTKIAYQAIWSKLYLELYYRYKFDVKARCRNSGRKPLEQIETDGMLEALYAIASEVLV
jgi:prophage antirepressor-like protein